MKRSFYTAKSTSLYNDTVEFVAIDEINSYVIAKPIGKSFKIMMTIESFFENYEPDLLGNFLNG
jgi:hypothetical protein